MEHVLKLKRYDTDTAAELHSFTFQGVSGYVPVTEALYRSPNEQLFIARYHRTHTVQDGELVELWTDLGCWRLHPIGDPELLEWLEKTEAPELAYEAAGFDIEEG